MNELSPEQSLIRTVLRCSALAAMVTGGFWVLRIADFMLLHAKLRHPLPLHPPKWRDAQTVLFWATTVLWLAGGARLILRPTARSVGLLRTAAWLSLALVSVSGVRAAVWPTPRASIVERIDDILRALMYMLDWLLLSVFMLWGIPKLEVVATPQRMMRWIGGGAIVCGAYELYGRARSLPNTIAGLVSEFRQPSWFVIHDVGVLSLTAAGVCWLLGGRGLLRRGGRRSSMLVSIACWLSVGGMACDVAMMSASMLRRTEAWYIDVAEIMSSMQWTLFGVIFTIVAVPVLAHRAVRSSFTTTGGHGFTPILKIQESAADLAARAMLV